MHVISRTTYLSIYVALLVLLVLTWGASLISLGRWNLLLALVIAGAKTMLIVMYFMHARYSSPLVRLFAFGGLLWFVLLVGLTVLDVNMRVLDVRRFGYDTDVVPTLRHTVEQNAPHRE